MATGWIDVHGHFTPPQSPEQLKVRWQAMREGALMAPKPFEWAPEGVLSYLDKAGIAMQMLSNIPTTIPDLKASNDYGASLVSKYPSRFGLLAALPTSNPDAALAEIDRARTDLHADGFAVTCVYNGISLSDSKLDPVWEKLNSLRATVFVHPNAYAPASQGRPAPLIEVAFETARTIVDMLYAGTLRRFTHIKWIIAHCGGALPALSGRLQLLGAEPWVPNPNGITKEEIVECLGRLYLDTAATAPTVLGPGIHMVGKGHIVYGADCGVPCSTEETMEANRLAILSYDGLSKEEKEAIGSNVLVLLPSAKERMVIAK